jgi:hypothetical protein
MSTIIANPEPVKVISRASECMRRLMEAGVTYDALQTPIDDPEMRQRLVNYWLAGAPEINVELPTITAIAYEPTPSQIRAREIMGKNFLGIEETMRHFNAAFTPEELATLAEIPFSEAELEECKNTHLLVCGYPMTILDIRAKAPNKKPKKTFYSYKDAWYNTQAFATNEKVGLRWYLIRKTAVEDSFSKTFDDQKQLLGANDAVPRACELVYAVVLYFMVTGERLFETVYVRCFDLASGGFRVVVGGFDSVGLDVVDGWGDGPDGGFGLSSARKSKK